MPDLSDILSGCRNAGADDGGIIVLNETGSTNDDLKVLALRGAPEFTAVCAKCQTAGKGRRGRSFYSPKDAGLYLSILLRPDFGKGFNAGDITCMAAVAVTDAIKEVCGIETGIKWVNDIYLGGKKICGILAETGSSDPACGVEFAVVGIGINLITPEGGYPDDIKDTAGSLLGEQSVDDALRTELAESIMKSFRNMYGSGSRDFVETYKKRCIFMNAEVDVISGGIARKAVTVGVDDMLRLIVRYEDGTEEALSYGEISVRKA